METIILNPTNKTQNLSKNIVSQKSAGQAKQKKRNRIPVQMGGRLPLYRYIPRSQVTTKVLRNVGFISTNGTGSLSLRTDSINNASGCPGFTTISPNFQSYRIKQFIITLAPSTVNATSTTGPYQGMICVSRWWGTSPSSTAQVIDDPHCLMFSTLQEVSFETNWKGFKDAEEWIQIGTSPLSSNLFGFCMVSVGSTMAANTNLFSAVFSYVVEFIGEQ